MNRAEIAFDVWVSNTPTKGLRLNDMRVGFLAGYARALEDAASIAQGHNDHDQLDTVTTLIVKEIRALQTK